MTDDNTVFPTSGNLVIIGNGMVGHHLVKTLVEQGDASPWTIHVFAGENRPAYDRVHLSALFDDQTPEDLCLSPAQWYRDNRVTLHLNDEVVEIDRDHKTVITAGGVRQDYDALVLATGSYPFVPPIPGHDHEHCLVYRTVDDLDAIKRCAGNAKRGVVVGGGLLGLEAANALRLLGLETHVVEFAPQLMPVQLDETGGALLRKEVEALGVHIHTGMKTELIDAGEQHTLRMNFEGQAPLETDMIVFSAGIRPQDSLGRQSSLELGERGGIVVDNQCRTSDPAIFAIGECALWNNQIFGLVAPGYTMARTVAAVLNNQPGDFTGADMSTKLKLMGVDVGSVGDAQARTAGARCYRFQDEVAGVYRKLVVSEDQKYVLGAMLVGDCDAYDTLLQYMLNGIPLPDNPASLILPAGDAAPALGADALPDGATICSCHNVSKGAINEALDGGCCSLGDIKDATKASTGCGGCAALLKSVVDAGLEARGVAVNNHLCEHFEYSRQELYHLILVGGLKSFREVRDAHGKGLGCEICKPAVASILASIHNDYILEPEHVGLQDTNDVFLANMQKDGTYSVVPRVPAGEITPEKLMTLGQVASKYDLYTKITGGQRIDLFGARLEQLPMIWEELIDAGFETGHAYGKSVRTVKSCVGSTWCRYGVQDSVGMAIFLEHRYKGLRSPHKLKFAVSGCTRECAEAQSKDIGVIATENGWNLYVCGNGGMRPRHADLFATDLSDQQLVQLVDRVLMFYVRTADRLQRTSVWLENLEGGLDYLRQVVIDDRLGIGAELEAQMDVVRERYQCEWRTTIDDPQKLKRFRSFVNAETPDQDIRFVRERGQPRPATEDERSDLIETVSV
ncbi:MAG: nitrite reductase large subunit NirB [Pseudomonadota bacterium]|nr:nitrite reductase large subunit NirB [Pseudomonadota bacterium]